MRKYLGISLLLIVLFSCYQRDHPDIESTKQLTSFNLESIIDTVDLLYSTIGKSVEIIPLETTPESFMGEGYNTYALNDKYIIIESKSRLMAFNSDGSFNGIISRKGKGPEEYISLLPNRIVNNIFWYQDSGKSRNKLFGINLDTNERMEIPIGMSGRINLNDFKFIGSDKLLLIAESIEKSEIQNVLISQDDRGNVSFQKQLNLVKDMRLREGPYRFHSFNGQSLVSNPRGDSVFTLVSDSLVLIFNCIVKDKSERPPLGTSLADRLSIIRYSDDYFLFIKHVQKVRGKAIHYSWDYSIFNRTSNSGHFFEATYFEEFGLRIPNKYMTDTWGERICFEITALDFIDLAKKAIESGNISGEKKDYLKSIVDNVHENDNPILLICNLK